MPSSYKVKQALLSLEISPGEVYELGAGWGGVAFTLADHCMESKITAYEISPLPLFYSKIMQLIKKKSNLTFSGKDFFKGSLEGADLIYCYLCPKLMQRLKSKFENELKPGCLIISHAFAVPGWQAARTIEVNDLWRSKLYLYVRR